MAHYYPGIDLSDVDENQMNGYLANVAQIADRNASAIAMLLGKILEARG